MRVLNPACDALPARVAQASPVSPGQSYGRVTASALGRLENYLRAITKNDESMPPLAALTALFGTLEAARRVPLPPRWLPADASAA